MDSLQRFVDADGSALLTIGLVVDGAVVVGTLVSTLAFEQHADAAVESFADHFEGAPAEATREVKGQGPAAGMLALEQVGIVASGRDFRATCLLVDPAKVSAWWIEPVAPSQQEEDEGEVPEGMERYDPDEYHPGFGVED